MELIHWEIVIVKKKLLQWFAVVWKINVLLLRGKGR